MAVDRHNLSFKEKDWKELNGVANSYKLELSAFLRAVLFLFRDHKDVIKPLLVEIIDKHRSEIVLSRGRKNKPLPLDFSGLEGIFGANK